MRYEYLMKLQFPHDFVWGTATSSFQIEGATDVDGRSESIWDRFCQVEGAIKDGSDGRIACEHYNRWPDDIEVLKEIGTRAYRFSIAWPRILPNGTGAVNEPGLDFYQKLTDGLLEAGIEPMITLYHWDLPQVLQDRGGWPHRDTAKAFVEYAHVVTRRLGDRVKVWVTHNEPWCISVLGHLTGDHAPGIKSTPEMLKAAHHVLLSHGWAVPVIREESKECQTGIVLNLVPTYPASESEHDAQAARSFDGRFNRWYLDPIYKGIYPEDIIEEHRKAGHLPPEGIPFEEPGDMEAMKVETDFLGINYYSRAIARSETVAEADNAPREIPVPPPEACTDMGWEVYPDGLHDILVRVHQDYAPKALYVAENGCAYPTGPDADGVIQDDQRIRYLESHLQAIHRVLEAGIPLKGYYLWSLLDNFEWAFGYEKRFGIVWVDYTTQKRTLKASARRYAEIIASNELECLD